MACNGTICSQWCRKDCVESLKRWGKKDRFGQLLMAHTAKLAPIEKKTFTLELAEHFGPVLDPLGMPSSNVPFKLVRAQAGPAGRTRHRASDAGPPSLSALPDGYKPSVAGHRRAGETATAATVARARAPRWAPRR
jgi:hypothetical protein